MYDYNTDCGSPCYGDLCGTIWDGTTISNTGSVNWRQTGGAGLVGNTTNGPVYGVPGDGFEQWTFGSFDCNGSLGSFLCGGWLGDIDGGLLLAGFTYECDLRFGNGDPAPVGGFSVSYARTNDPVVTALNAGDIVPQMIGQVSPNGGRFSDYGSASDLSILEQGTTTGLSVGFQMADNGNYHIPPEPGAVGVEAPGITHDGIGLHVRVDGKVIAVVPMPNATTQQTYDQEGTPLTITDPTGTNAATDFRAIETGPYDGSGCDTNLLWVHFKMNLSTNSVLNVWWKNFQIITNLPTGLAPYAGRFVVAGRVGSQPANIERDNVAITTVVFVPPPTNTNPPSISIEVSNGEMVISYSGTLQYSSTATGGFQDWQGASNPFAVPLAHLDVAPGAQLFFRARW